MKLLISFLLISFAFAADVKDPVLRPPQQTIATRANCTSPFGCVAYNSELKIFEGFNGTEWDAFGVSGIVEDSLVSTSTNNALSANQGRVLDQKIIPLQTNMHTHANKALLDVLTSAGLSTQFLSADGTYKTPIDLTGGTGNVIGPASSVVNQIALYSDTTGKLLKTSAVSISANVIQVPYSSGELAFTGSGSTTGYSWDHFYLGSPPGYFGLKAPASITTGYILTVPSVKPTANQFLRSDASGILSWVNAPTGVIVEDALVSTSTVNALSANQGRVLDAKIAPLQTSSHTHTNKSLLDSLTTTGLATQFLSADGTYKTPIDNNTVILVMDSLVSTSTTAALSANQGRILDGKIATNTADIATNASSIASNTANISLNTTAINSNTGDIATNTADITSLQTDSHTHANKILLDSLTSTGTPTEFLAADGNYKLPIALTTWEAGKAYKAGEMVNSGSDGNWLFKVIQDHTSVDVPADFRTGKIMAIAPPIITTGVQDGGEVSLAGNLATIQGGTGYIAKYGTSPSAWPLVTIVEWTTQSITVPATGIHALYIDEDGTLILGAPAGDIRSASDDTISVAIVDMNLGLIYDRKTFPTNPVGQLRGLSVFLGVMTKGLSYVANGLQLSRSEHDIYFWGADPFNPYNPNKKTVPALPIADFYEFDQDGAVLPAIRITTLKNTIYDNNGTQTAMNNNRWTFIRIYSSPGSDNYIMYGQGQWQTEAEAKEAATSRNFIRPADLELTKFSAWFTFIKGDNDFSDNIITVCEPFGCDKIGSTAGGGAGGIGDVVGPASAIVDNIPTFADSSGKVIKDSGIAISGIHTHANKILLDSLVSNGTPTQFLSADGTYKTPVDTNTITVIPTCTGSQRLTGNGTILICVDNNFSNLGTIAAAGTATCNINANHICYYTATGNHTVAFSGTPVLGTMFQIIVTSTTAYTISWPVMKWPSGLQITSTKANAHSVFTIVYTPGGYLVTGVEDLK